jgi:hypothetical protein
VYSVFRHPNVVLTRAIEVPTVPGVRFHHMISVALDNLGEISNVHPSQWRSRSVPCMPLQGCGQGVELMILSLRPRRAMAAFP